MQSPRFALGALDEQFDEAAVTLSDIKSTLSYEMLKTSKYELLNTSHELTFQDFEVFFSKDPDPIRG